MSATPLGLEFCLSIYSQGSRGGNPGLEGATAVRLALQFPRCISREPNSPAPC